MLHGPLQNIIKMLVPDAVNMVNVNKMENDKAHQLAVKIFAVEKRHETNVSEWRKW